MASALPVDISIAPFPEGFQGDMDETFQQAVQLMSGTVQGNFLTGLILPPGSTLPTSDQGPIAMNETWYFWDSATNQYLPQTATSKPAKNYVKNPIYQIAQQGNTITPAVGVTNNYDMAITRCNLASSLAISPVVGPTAANGYDTIGSAIKYTIGPALVSAPAATDLYAHEHLIEGCDISMLQGQILTLSFLVWVNTGGLYSVYITNKGRDHSYLATFTISAAQASTWQRIIVPNIPAMPVATGTWNFGEGQTGLYIGIPFAVGTQYQTGGLNQWNAALYCGTSGQTNLMAVNNNQIAITGIKLEASVNAGYLAAPPFENDFEDCIRYFWTSYSYQSTTVGVFGINLIAPSAGQGTGTMLFPKRMCKVPAVTFYSPASNIAGTMFNLTTGVAVTAFGAPSVTQKGVTFNGAITTPASAKSDVIVADLTADARLS